MTEVHLSCTAKRRCQTDWRLTCYVMLATSWRPNARIMAHSLWPCPWDVRIRCSQRLRRSKTVNVPSKCMSSAMRLRDINWSSIDRAMMWNWGVFCTPKAMSTPSPFVRVNNWNYPYAYNQLFSIVPKRPFVDFTTDEIVTPAEAASYMKRNIYDAFCSIFGNGQHYLPNSQALIINRGHLVASADFLFVDQMSSTFRYLNIVPQFKSINDGNWEKIERWIRSQVPSSPFRIKTGGIDVLTLADQNGAKREAYLTGSKVPVPMWTFKVVRDFNGNGVYVFSPSTAIWRNRGPLWFPFATLCNVLSACQIIQMTDLYIAAIHRSFHTNKRSFRFWIIISYAIPKNQLSCP